MNGKVEMSNEALSYDMLRCSETPRVFWRTDLGDLLSVFSEDRVSHGDKSLTVSRPCPAIGAQDSKMWEGKRPCSSMCRIRVLSHLISWQECASHHRLLGKLLPHFSDDTYQKNLSFLYLLRCRHKIEMSSHVLWIDKRRRDWPCLAVCVGALILGQLVSHLYSGRMLRNRKELRPPMSAISGGDSSSTSTLTSPSAQKHVLAMSCRADPTVRVPHPRTVIFSS